MDSNSNDTKTSPLGMFPKYAIRIDYERQTGFV